MFMILIVLKGSRICCTKFDYRYLEHAIHLNYIIRQSQKAPGHLIHGTCQVDNDNLLQCPGFILQPLQMLMINNVIMMGKVPGPVVGLI